MWKKIYTYLKDKGIEVYAPAQHIGECTTKYVVVKNAGVQGSEYSTTVGTYNIMCYVPKEQFSQLEAFVSLIKSYLKSWQNTAAIRPTGLETPSFYDEEIKGHMISIQYNVYKKV